VPSEQHSSYLHLKEEAPNTLCLPHPAHIQQNHLGLGDPILVLALFILLHDSLAKTSEGHKFSKELSV
jgi:hypothetical protein